MLKYSLPSYRGLIVNFIVSIPDSQLNLSLTKKHISIAFWVSSYTSNSEKDNSTKDNSSVLKFGERWGKEVRKSIQFTVQPISSAHPIRIISQSCSHHMFSDSFITCLRTYPSITEREKTKRLHFSIFKVIISLSFS